jgi:hypothetical protein
MRRFLLALALSAAALLAQTTVYLRSGTPGAFATISGATNTNPITITTTAAHGFSVGDLIYIQQVYGNWSANGLRKVASTPLTTTFTITDINNNPITGNGVYTYSGFAGKVTAHTLVSHPRLLFDGPTGPTTTIMNGSATTSIRADPTSLVYQGMTYLNNNHTGTGDSNPNLANTGLDWGAASLLLAEGWFMDRTQTAWRDAGKWLINNAEKRLASGTTAGTQYYPGFFAASVFGRGSDADWASVNSEGYMYAYSLLHDQFTPTERQAFADKILNNKTDFGENCTQSLMPWQAGTLSMVQGSTAITGVGTNFSSMSGYPFLTYLPPTTNKTTPPLNWTAMPTIVDATHMTLPAAASATVTGATFAPVRYWQTGDCGWRFYVRGHNYSPMYDRRRLFVTTASSVGTSDTSIHVVALPPKTPPYIITYGTGEFMLVTAHTDSTHIAVTRGYLNTTGQTVPNGKGIGVMDPLENTQTPGSSATPYDLVPYDDPRHNLVMAKLYGYLTAGLALADDDERARLMFEQAFNYWYDFVYPYDKRSWTGITQSAGNPGYNRRQTYNVILAKLFLNSLNPPVDVTGGSWLTNAFDYFRALDIPGSVSSQIGMLPFADSLNNEFDFAPRHLDSSLIDLSMFPTDPKATRFNWWLRTKRGYWALSNFQDSYAMELTAYGILLPGPSETQIAQTDPTVSDLPVWTMNTVDLADSRQSPIGVWVSKSDWTDSATSILALSIQRPSDHIGSYPGPGAYKIAKGPKILAGDGGTAATNPSARTWSNYLQAGTTRDTGGANGGGLIDRNSNSSAYSYIRINNAGTNSQAYLAALGVQRAYRHLLHVKGSVDTLFAYDDMVTSSATDKLQNFYFYSDNYETPTFSLTGCIATYKRPTSQLITAYVLPASPTCTHPLASGLTYSIEGNVYSVGQYKLHQLVVDAGNLSSVNMLAVHKAFSDTTSTMAATTVLSTASTHDGVQVAGANPAVVLFPKNGTTPALSAGFTSTHTGTAAIFVAGMVPGNYGVTVNGGASTNYVADSSGVLNLSGGAAGTYAITNSDSQVPLSIGTTTLPDATLSVSYFMQLLGVGGVVPYTWAITAGSLPAGLSLNTGSGVISGTPTVTGTFSFTVRLADSASTVVTQALSLNVGVGVLPVGVTTTSPNPAFLYNGSVVIVASTVGGSAPFAWTLPTNTAGCSPTTGSGNTFSITCTQPGDVDILVTDSASNTADVSLSVVAQPLAISPGSVSIGLLAGETFTASGGTPPYTWSAPGATTVSGTGTTFTTSWATVGGYEVNVTDAASSAAGATVTVSATVTSAIAGKARVSGRAQIQ